MLPYPASRRLLGSFSLRKDDAIDTNRLFDLTLRSIDGPVTRTCYTLRSAATGRRPLKDQPIVAETVVLEVNIAHPKRPVDTTTRHLLAEIIGYTANVTAEEAKTLGADPNTTVVHHENPAEILGDREVTLLGKPHWRSPTIGIEPNGVIVLNHRHHLN